MQEGTFLGTEHGDIVGADPAEHAHRHDDAEICRNIGEFKEEHLFLAFRRQEENHAEHRQHHRTGRDATLPVDFLIVEGMCRHHCHDEDGHIVPSCIVGAVEHIECTVQERHKGTEDADPCQEGCPVLLFLTHEGDHASHGEEGQIAADGCPFSVVRGEEIGSCRGIGDHEKALDDPEDSGLVAVKEHILSSKCGGYSGIAHDRQHGRQEYHACNADTEHRFDRKSKEFFHVHMKVPAIAADEEIQHKEHDLSGEEEIVIHRHDRHDQCKPSTAVVVHQFLHCNEHQGEEGCHILKMVEEQVKDLKAGKGVQ